MGIFFPMRLFHYPSNFIFATSFISCQFIFIHWIVYIIHTLPTGKKSSTGPQSSLASFSGSSPPPQIHLSPLFPYRFVGLSYFDHFRQIVASFWLGIKHCLIIGKCWGHLLGGMTPQQSLCSFLFWATVGTEQKKVMIFLMITLELQFVSFYL